jgi:hypothetical protein
LSPFSTSRLIASGREGRGSGWLAIQASSAASCSGGMRTVTGSALMRGRPLTDFLDIDGMIF